MSYCLNPHCQKPQNQKNAQSCVICGTALLLKQRYRAIKSIGQGGFGRTLLAVDETKPLKPPCVIKQFLLMAQGTNNTEKAAELFKQEALRLNNLGKHNQIPNLLDYLTQEEHQYLVQEYIDGYDLAEILKEQGTFKEAQIWELLNSLLPVLEYIHNQDVIHRDIKPENIIRSKNGQLFLVDFGAAKVVTGTAILQTGTSIGTPEFVAPEQSRGKAIYSSDLYSLGTTCIYLLTGISPFDLFDISEYTWVWRQYLVNNQVGDRLGNILDKLIENATSRRYQSATEILKDINPPKTYSSNNNQIEDKQLRINNFLNNQPQNNQLAFKINRKSNYLPEFAVDNKQDFNYTNTEKIQNSSTLKKSDSGWKCINTLHHHAAAINSIDISSDGVILASSSDYCATKLWNIKTGKLIRTHCSDYPINAVAFSPNGLIIASGDSANNILLWDVNSGKQIHFIKGHTGLFAGVSSLSFSSDGRMIASAGSDKTVRLWNVNTGLKIHTLIGHDRWVSSVAIDPDGKFIVSGSADTRAIIWELTTGKIVNTLRTSSKVNSVAFSLDGKTIATGNNDRTVRFWEVSTGQEIYSLEGYSSGVSYVTFSPDGKILASSSDNNDIKLWDMNTKQEISTLTGHSAKVNSLAFSPDGRTLFSGSDDKTIKVWRYE